MAIRKNLDARKDDNDIKYMMGVYGKVHQFYVVDGRNDTVRTWRQTDLPGETLNVIETEKKFGIDFEKDIAPNIDWSFIPENKRKVTEIAWSDLMGSDKVVLPDPYSDNGKVITVDCSYGFREDSYSSVINKLYQKEINSSHHTGLTFVLCDVYADEFTIDCDYDEEEIGHKIIFRNPDIEDLFIEPCEGEKEPHIRPSDSFEGGRISGINVIGEYVKNPENECNLQNDIAIKSVYKLIKSNRVNEITVNYNYDEGQLGLPQFVYGISEEDLKSGDALYEINDWNKFISDVSKLPEKNYGELTVHYDPEEYELLELSESLFMRFEKINMSFSKKAVIHIPMLSKYPIAMMYIRGVLPEVRNDDNGAHVDVYNRGVSNLIKIV